MASFEKPCWPSTHGEPPPVSCWALPVRRHKERTSRMSIATLERPLAARAARAPEPPLAARGIVAPLAAIVLGTFMVILDNTVVNVALPTLGRVFQTDLRLLQWVITAYMLAQAAVIPLSGWLSDRFGAKRVYLTSLVLFTLGSTLCGLAQS